MITSRQNPKVNDAVRLRDRRQRERQQRFLIEGIREVDRAIRGGVSILEAFVAPELATSEAARLVIEALEHRSVKRHDVASEVFEKLAYGDRTEGIVAVARMTSRTLDDLVLPPRPIVAVLEAVEKPGNLGAIARSADAAGVAALIVVGQGTDIYNPNSIRASLGALFTVPVAEADAASALHWAKRLGLPVFAARTDAQMLYTDAPLASGGVLVLGSEAEGLSDAWRDPSVTPIRLPMHGVGDSLNVSATAAVLFYEALRQRLADET
jgi:TrmH family RNA methyltransferase